MKNDFSYNKGFSLKNEKNFILSSESLTNIFSDPYFYEKHCKLVKKIFGRNTHILIVLKKPSDLFKSIYLENNFLNQLKKEINYSISYSSEIFHKSISGSSLNFLIKFFDKIFINPARQISLIFFFFKVWRILASSNLFLLNL